MGQAVSACFRRLVGLFRCGSTLPSAHPRAAAALPLCLSHTAHPTTGDGVPVNPAIAHRLLLLLAELGNAEAQADVGFHLALGVEPVAPNSRDQLFRCGRRRPGAAAGQKSSSAWGDGGAEEQPRRSLEHGMRRQAYRPAPAPVSLSASRRLVRRPRPAGWCLPTCPPPWCTTRWRRTRATLWRR